MAAITTKYSIGDRVWSADTTTERKRHSCPDCLEQKKWIVTSPVGVKYEFPCPRCSARYSGDREASLNYTAFAPRTRQLTIGSVRIDTNDKDNPVSYMCEETGIGSGTVHDEGRLFLTREEALAAAQLDADRRNAETEWGVEQYKSALDVSDYTLKEAVEVVREREARDRVQKLESLIGDIKYATNMDEVRELIEPKAEAA